MQKLNLSDIQKVGTVLDANNISLYDFKVNICYDTPINGIVEVFKNGSLIDDFHLYDLKDFDEYAYYDKVKLIAIVADYCKDEDYKDFLIVYLNENLKSTIDYGYWLITLSFIIISFILA